MQKHTKTNQKTPIAIIVVLGIVIMFLIIKIGNLREELERARWQTQDSGLVYSQWMAINAYREALRTLENAFSNHLSVLADGDIRVTSIDIDELTVQFEISVVPRIVFEGMSISLDIDGYVVQMQQDGSGFSALIVQDIFTQSVKPSILINDGYSTTIAHDPRIEIENVRNAIFPQYEARFDGARYLRNGVLELEGRITFRPAWGMNTSSYAHFVSGKVITMLNDEVIDTTLIANISQTSIPYNILMDFEPGRFVVVVSVVDNLGLTHNFMAIEEGIRRVPGVPAIQNAYGEIL